ncbi:MAG TPA: hypothetical protein VHX44_12895 [Planctomycetota bacterium]|nr:hypothetical protein [Planctomycetota bacterium]
MIDQREIIWGVLAPPVLMAIGMVATASVPVAKRFFSTGALLALVFGISQLGFRGWPAPGGDVQNWPAWIAFAGGLITLCSACGQGPLPWRISARLAITGLATWLLLGPQLQSTGAAVAWIGGVAITWTALILVWERAHAASSAGVSVTALTALAGFTSASLLLFNCMTHAQYAGILTAALTAALVLNWWRPTWYAAASPVTVAALVLPTLWILGQRYADLPLWAVPLLALATLAPLASNVGPVRTWSAWKRVAVAVVATVIVVAPVLVWGVVTSIKASSEPSYGY